MDLATAIDVLSTLIILGTTTSRVTTGGASPTTKEPHEATVTPSTRGGRPPRSVLVVAASSATADGTVDSALRRAAMHLRRPVAFCDVPMDFLAASAPTLQLPTPSPPLADPGNHGSSSSRIDPKDEEQDGNKHAGTFTVHTYDSPSAVIDDGREEQPFKPASRRLPSLQKVSSMLLPAWLSQPAHPTGPPGGVACWRDLDLIVGSGVDLEAPTAAAAQTFSGNSLDGAGTDGNGGNSDDATAASEWGVGDGVAQALAEICAALSINANEEAADTDSKAVCGGGGGGHVVVATYIRPANAALPTSTTIGATAGASGATATAGSHAVSGHAAVRLQHHERALALLQRVFDATVHVAGCSPSLFAEINAAVVGAQQEANIGTASTIATLVQRDATEVQQDHTQIEKHADPGVGSSGAGSGGTTQQPTRRQVFTTTWDDIAGLADAKRLLRGAFAAFSDARRVRVMRAARVAPAMGILLYGVPGTGKTMLARALATEVTARQREAGATSNNNGDRTHYASAQLEEKPAPFFVIDVPSIVCSEVGRSEERLAAVFDAARAQSPSVILIDEAQAAFGRRDAAKGGSTKGGGAHDARLLTCLLRCMDAARDAFLDGACGPVLVVCATNVPHLLDPDLLCATRVGVRVHVPPPEQDAIRALAGAVLSDWGWPAGEAEDAEETIGAWIRDKALPQWASADGAAATGADLRNALNVLALQTAALAETDEGGPTRGSSESTETSSPSSRGKRAGANGDADDDEAGEAAPAARVLRLLSKPQSDAAAVALVTATLARVRPSVRREDVAPLIAFASS